MEKPNLDYIKEISAGSEEFEQKFIDIIKSEFPKEKSDYLTFFDKGELDESSKVVHKIKHKFGILGMKDSYELAIKYEKDLKAGDTKLKDDFSGVLNMVDEFIVKIT